MSQSYEQHDAKKAELWSARSIAYLLLGVGCFVCAVVAAFGSMFSSILLSAEMAGLVAAPIFIGLAGMRTPNRIFPAFEAFGCCAMLISLGAIYVGDLKTGAAPNAFIHDPLGWSVGGMNVAQLVLSLDRLRSRKTHTA